MSMRRTTINSIMLKNSIKNITENFRDTLKRAKTQRGDYYRPISIKKISGLRNSKQSLSINKKQNYTESRLTQKTLESMGQKEISSDLKKKKKKIEPQNNCEIVKKPLCLKSEIKSKKNEDKGDINKNDIFMDTKFSKFCKDDEIDYNDKVLKERLILALEKQNDLREENFLLRDKILKLENELEKKNNFENENKIKFNDLQKIKNELENSVLILKSENENLKLKFKLKERNQFEENLIIQKYKQKNLNKKDINQKLKVELELNKENQEVFKNLYNKEKEKVQEFENNILKMKTKETSLISLIDKLQSQLELLKEENDQTWKLLIS